jgi:hypothetical protein
MVNMPNNYASHMHRNSLLTFASIEHRSLVRDLKIHCCGKRIYCNLTAVIAKCISSETVAKLVFEWIFVYIRGLFHSLRV